MVAAHLLALIYVLGLLWLHFALPFAAFLLLLFGLLMPARPSEGRWPVRLLGSAVVAALGAHRSYIWAQESYEVESGLYMILMLIFLGIGALYLLAAVARPAPRPGVGEATSPRQRVELVTSFAVLGFFICVGLVVLSIAFSG